MRKFTDLFDVIEIAIDEMQNYVVIEIAIDEMQNYVDEYGSVRVVEELCNYLDSRYGIGNPVTAQ